ncbi:hypothetical protein JKA73_34165 [Myxococcus xanthus]|uniref:OTU domain-containing protein n=1 Tax=Myxococcus xanthus TaxID=34 RepID=UPI00191718CD|nr:hypothetical protein [Myxococcus xanthus]QQR43991.1 hypothetical protein JKA73_34165 [Myxococcus xanthus]
MSCPHLDGSPASAGIAGYSCPACGPVCAACWPTHVCPVSESPAMDVTEVRDEASAGSYSNEALLDADVFERKSTGDMLYAVSQALTAEESHLPESHLPDEDLVQEEPSETVVPLGATSTLAPVAKDARRPVPLRLLLWNVANLGGKFGYPYPRPDTTIAATARIIHAAKPDVVTILEVLERGQPDRAPKPPAAISARPPRSAQNMSWERFLRRFGCTGEGMADVLMSQVGPAFIGRVHAAIWPGAAPYEDEPESAFTVTGLSVEVVRNAWAATCQKKLAAAFPKPAGGAPVSGEEEDEEAETAQILAEDINNRRPGGEPALAVWRSQVMPLLVQEGYTHWLQRHVYNYKRSGENEEGLPLPEAKARDARCKSALEEIEEVITYLWRHFLFALMEKEAPVWKKKPAKESPDALSLQFLWYQLLLSNHAGATEDYEQRLKEYEARQALKKSKSTVHPGIEEFIRIRDALNALGGPTYDSWPAAVPEGAVKGLYTRAETYGVLWRKDRVRVSLEGVKYLGQHAEDAGMEPVVFNKREPLVVPIELLDAEGAPKVGIIPWHAPAPSSSNSAARAKDFPAFIDYCQQARKAQHLEVLLSDLNVDTEKPQGTVEHCDIEMTWAELFSGIRGPTATDRALLAHDGGWSTLPKSKFRPWAVNDVNVAKRLAPSWLASIKVLQEKAGSMEAGQERSELEARAKWMSGSTDLLDALKRRLSAEDFQPLLLPRSGKTVPQRFDSPNALLGHIESFASPPQRRFGASAYDKIYPIATQSDAWRLVYKSGFVVPFPHALLYADEPELLFIPEESLPVRVRPWLRLLAGSEAGQAILEALRPTDERPGKSKSEQARYEALMAAARKLSDHMPVVADLLLVDSDAPVLPLEETPFVPVAVQPVAPHIEQLCVNYETSTEGPLREQALTALVEGWENAPDEERSPAATRRVQGALQHHEALSESRDKLEDSEARHTSRKQSALPGKATNAKTLNVHLTEQRQHVVTNGGGGDCLFRSLAQLVFGDETRHLEMRWAVVNHLEDLLAGRSPDAGNQVGPEPLASFRQAMKELLDWHRVQWPNAFAYRRVYGIPEWQQYFLGMRHAGEWGDLIAISAASHLLGVRFRVYARLVGGAFWTDEVNFVDAAQGEVWEYTLLNSGNYHFELVLGDDAVDVEGGFVAPPAGWDALAMARRGAAEAPIEVKSDNAMDVMQEEDAPPSVVVDDVSRVMNGASINGARLPHAPVILWDDQFWWQLTDAAANRDCLFVFGENDLHKKTPPVQRQTSTQALLREEPNAIGIRTCWAPGAMWPAGNMKEREHAAKNVPVITADLDEVKKALQTKKYRALVVPWEMARNRVALGVGIAKLPRYAPTTYTFLNDEILNLIDWAKKNLGTVQVLARNTGLVTSVAQSDPKTLFIDETSEAMRQAGPPGGNSSMVLGGEDNILLVSTLLLPGAESSQDGLLTDDTEAENTKRLDRDFDDIEQKIMRGQFHRVSLPADADGNFLLGERLGRLKTSAPNTWKHLEARLQRLIELCEKTRVMADASPAASGTPAYSDSDEEVEAPRLSRKRSILERGWSDTDTVVTKQARGQFNTSPHTRTDASDDVQGKRGRKRSADEGDDATQPMEDGVAMQGVVQSLEEEEAVDTEPVAPPARKKSRLGNGPGTPSMGDEEGE